MSLPLLPLFLVASLLLSLATTTVCLWLGTRLTGSGKASLRRLLGAAIGICLFGAVISCLRLAVDFAAPSLLMTAGGYLVLLAIFLLVPWYWICWVLRTSLGKAALVWGVVLVNARAEAVTVDNQGNGAPAADSPDAEDRVAITASGGAMRLARIMLHRDVYYLTPESMRMEHGAPVPTDEYHPCALADGEYFVLGDNSLQSKDSRFWGTVPHSAILGPVECIYWPPNRCRAFR